MDKELNAFAAKIRELGQDLEELYQNRSNNWYTTAQAENVRYAIDKLSDAADLLAK